MQAKGGNAGVVKEGTFQPRRGSNFAQFREIALAFADQVEVAAREPGIDRRERRLEWGGSLEYLRMGYYSDKLMNTRPGNGPRSRLRTQGLNQLLRRDVKWTVRAMGIDEQICVHRNHA